MLNKSSIPINFAKGLDLKTDPFQLSPANFLALENSVFTTTGRLTKRNGFKEVTALPVTNQSTIMTFDGNLVTTGSNLYAYSQDIDKWLNKGSVKPVALSTLSLVRNGESQSSPDFAIASNGLICLVYIESSQAYYQVSDSSTGQEIVARQALPSSAVFPRVFLVGNYFVVTYLATVSGGTHLQYIGIPISNPTSPRAIMDFATNVASLSTAYDGIYVADNNQLYIAYGAGGSAIKIAYITAALTTSSFTTISSAIASLLAICNDTSLSRVVLSYWDGTDIYSAALIIVWDKAMSQTTLILLV